MESLAQCPQTNVKSRRQFRHSAIRGFRQSLTRLLRMKVQRYCLTDRPGETSWARRIDRMPLPRSERRALRHSIFIIRSGQVAFSTCITGTRSEPLTRASLCPIALTYCKYIDIIQKEDPKRVDVTLRNASTTLIRRGSIFG